MGMAAVLLNAHSVVKLFAFLSTFMERTLSEWAGSRGRGPHWEAMDLGPGAKIQDQWMLSNEIKPGEQRPCDSHCAGLLSSSPWLG